MAFVVGRRERKKLATRQALAFAALRLAIEKGLDNVLVEDIAAAANVSPRTFNNYFTSKYEAICSLATDRAQRIGARLRARPGEELLWPAIVHAILAEFDDDLTPDANRIAGARLITSAPALRGEYLKSQAALRDSLSSAIIERGGYHATDLYPKVLAGAVAAALEAAVTRWLDTDPPGPILPVVREALRHLTLIPGEFPMDVPTSHTLTVPGATLYYEIRGAGPVLLLIPGGNGDAATYAQIAPLLADRYTVVSYDRRGFTRSPADSVPAYRVRTDAQDAAALLTHLTTEPAFVLGSSSGAIVALELISRHPNRIRTLIAHEPPLVTLLDDSATQLAFLDEVYAIGRREGTQAAMETFRTGIGMSPPPRASDETPSPELLATIERIQRNLQFWMEHEMRQYPRHPVDFDALDAAADKVVFAVGAESIQTMPGRPAAVLAKRFGREAIEFPGDHIGYLAHPAEFAKVMAEVLNEG